MPEIRQVHGVKQIFTLDEGNPPPPNFLDSPKNSKSSDLLLPSVKKKQKIL